MKRRDLLLAVPALPLLQGCGAVIAALPVVTRIVVDAMAVLQAINNVVQEIFRTRPDVPLVVRRRYTQLFDGAMVSLRTLHAAAEAGQDLSDGQVAAALEAFEAAYEELRQYIGLQGWMRSDGAMVIDGEVVSEMRVPPAAELRR